MLYVLDIVKFVSKTQDFVKFVTDGTGFFFFLMFIPQVSHDMAFLPYLFLFKIILIIRTETFDWSGDKNKRGRTEERRTTRSTKHGITVCRK